MDNILYIPFLYLLGPVTMPHVCSADGKAEKTRVNEIFGWKGSCFKSLVGNIPM